MRYSLRFKLTGILIAIVSCVIFITWFLNMAFAERFYELSEKKNVIQTYQRIEEILYESQESDKKGDASEDESEDASDDAEEENAGDDDESDQFGSSNDAAKTSNYKGIKNGFGKKGNRENILTNGDDDSFDEVGAEIIELCNRSNIRMMITKPDSYLLGQDIVYTNVITNSGTYNELLWYLNQIRTRFMFGSQFDLTFSEHALDQFSLFDSDNDSWSSMVNNGYVVRLLKNLRGGNSGIYLFGYTRSKHFVGMIVPLEGIKTSAAISSRFLLYVGIVAILIGSIAILIVSSKFTKPIIEMAGIADKMSHLDFDAKIRINTKDELELLGNSMNTLSETLESTIGDLKSANLELQKDIEKREEIDEMRKEFLSHVSHELKTPIALIQGYAEGLSENIMDDEESKDFYCEVISDEAQKMNTMVQKLLTLNQIEFGNTQLELQRFDICQLIRNKVQSSQILIMKNNIRVEFDQEDPVYVWADEFMIEEVFSNYFSNALHYVVDGGLIRIWLEPLDKDVRIHVFNEGKHIPEEDIDKLWIKFYKVDKARTREYGGSGIGLSIVAATINAHGKKFGVNNVEKGVDFYFDLDTEN